MASGGEGAEEGSSHTRTCTSCITLHTPHLADCEEGAEEGAKLLHIRAENRVANDGDGDGEVDDEDGEPE